MYIKTIKIQAFGCFQKLVILDNLEKNIYLIIGENGSGKSTILKGIHLVLSQDYKFLHKDEKDELISKNQNGELQSFVEIELSELENTILDFQLDKSENLLILKRVFNSEKSTLFVNGTMQKDTEPKIQSLLKSSLSCFVRQNEIGHLISIGEKERLQLIKHWIEVDQRIDVIGIFEKEWQLYRIKQKQIKNCLDEFNNILQALDQDSQEYEEFQKINKKIRLLEILKGKKENGREKSMLLDSLEKLKQLETQQSKILVDLNVEISQLISTLKVDKSNLILSEENIDLKSEEKEILDQKMKKLERMVDNFNRKPVNSKKTVEEIVSNEPQNWSEIVRQRIRNISNEWFFDQDQRKEKMENFNLKREKIKEYETELLKNHKEISKKEAEKMLCKNALKTKCFGPFDQSVINIKNAQLQQINSMFQHSKRKISSEEIQDEKTKEQEIHEKMKILEKLENDLIKKITKLDKSKIKEQKAVEKRNSMLKKQKEIWENMEDLYKQKNQQEPMKSKIEKKWKQLVGFNMIEAEVNIKKIVNEFRNSPKEEETTASSNYYGLLIDNILSATEDHFIPLSIVAGKKLFYHVVKTKESSLVLMNEFNRRKYKGELNILVEENLHLNENELLTYQRLKNERVQPLIDLISYCQEATRSFQYVFGRFLLVSDMENKVLRKNCVTPEGDMLKYNGIITGGFLEQSKCALQVKLNKDRMNEIFSEIEQLIEELKINEKLTTEEIFNVDVEISKLKQEQITLKRSIKDLKMKCSEIFTIFRSEIQKKPLNFKLKEAEEAMLGEIEARKKEMENGFKYENLDGMSINKLEDEIVKLTETYSQKKCEYERLLKDLEFYEEIHFKAMLETEEYEDQADVIKNELNDSTRNELLELEINKMNLIEKLNELKTENSLVESQIGRKKEMVFGLNKEQDECRSTLHKIRKEQEEIVLKMNDLVRIQELDENCEELEQLIEEFPEYAENEADLGDEYKRLKNIRNNSTVNLRVKDQIEDITDRFNSLQSNNSCIKNEFNKLKDLFIELQESIPVFEKEILARIQHMFNQEYKEMIRISGKKCESQARIVFTSKLQTDSQDPTEFENFCGMKMVIQLDNGKEVDVRSLSGGQKTLLGFAFLSAIQHVCKIDVKLFDEMDQALDKVHRESLAKLLQRSQQKHKTQYFCTTFSRELLNSADKIFHVKHSGTSSFIEEITAQNAATLYFLNSSSSDSEH